MGLFSIIRKTKAKEKEVRLLILGLDNAGKTTILKKFIGEDIKQISPTLGFNIKTVEFMELKLNFWDVGGQTTIRSYWRNYFEETDGIIWVVDSGDKMRLKDCALELHDLLKQEKLSGASLLVLCNKQDVSGSFSVDDIAKELDLKSIKSRHWAVQACSAVTGNGLNDGIKWISMDIKSRIFLME